MGDVGTVSGPSEALGSNIYPSLKGRIRTERLIKKMLKDANEDENLICNMSLCFA